MMPGARPPSNSQFKGMALVARSRPARIHLLDGSLYTWLGAKALSQVSLMRRNQRGILLRPEFQRFIYPRLSPGQADGSVEISVSDSGIGISPEDQAKIFEEFRQVGGDHAHKREGRGLRLTLAKKFVELHGGKIWALLSALLCLKDHRRQADSDRGG